MGENIIVIPNTINKIEWINFIFETRQKDFLKFDFLVIDFNNCDFLDTGCLTMLACLIEEIYNKKCLEIKYIGGVNPLTKHLKNIRFKEYWIPGFNRDAYTNSRNKTTLCLWHISSNMIETFAQQAQAYYKRQFFQHLDLQPFSSTLVEIFNNVFNHSDSVIDGYVLTQYFPSIKRMSFAVCDFGKGIPTSINDYQFKNHLPPYYPECYAIKKSLEAGISAKSIPQNAGLGLSNVLDFSENTDGTLAIYSNFGSYIKKSDQEYPDLGVLKTPYEGTLVTLNINTSFFEKFDEEDEIFDFYS